MFQSKIKNMQINLLNPAIKECFKYLGWPLLFLTLWFNGCSDNEKSLVTETVAVPKIEASFEAKKPVNTPILIKANSQQLKKDSPMIKISYWGEFPCAEILCLKVCA